MTGDARRARAEALAGQVREPQQRYLPRRTEPGTAQDRRSDGPLLLERRPALPLVLAGAAAAVALVGVGAAVLPADDVAPAQDGALALTVAPSDPLTSICAPFDAAVLRGFPLAFAGTATALQDGTVTLEVTRWYRGGDATTVVLAAPGSAALTGFDVQVGEDYLVTAQDGAVTDCGYSGAATPELEAAYAQAFGG